MELKFYSTQTLPSKYSEPTETEIKKSARQEIEYRREKRKEREKRMKIPTRVIDMSDTVPVRIDSKTIIYVKRGVDTEKIFKKYSEAMKKFKI